MVHTKIAAAPPRAPRPHGLPLARLFSPGCILSLLAVVTSIACNQSEEDVAVIVGLIGALLGESFISTQPLSMITHSTVVWCTRSIPQNTVTAWSMSTRILFNFGSELRKALSAVLFSRIAVTKKSFSKSGLARGLAVICTASARILFAFCPLTIEMCSNKKYCAVLCCRLSIMHSSIASRWYAYAKIGVL